MSIHVSVYDRDRIAAMLKNVPAQAPTVISRALNRAAESARTNVVQQATKEYYIKASDVRRTIEITKATRSRLRVVINSRGTKRELAAFRVSPTSPNPRKPPPMLQVAVRKTTGFQGLPGAFLVRGTSSGKLHVTERLTRKRYPIQTMYGLAVPQMLGANLTRREYRGYVEREAARVFAERLEHEITRLLGGK